VPFFDRFFTLLKKYKKKQDIIKEEIGGCDIKFKGLSGQVMYQSALRFCQIKIGRGNIKKARQFNLRSFGSH
jgi:hypothetical protein